MIFNGIDFGDYFKVEQIRRNLLPPLINLDTETPGRNGSRFIKNKLGIGKIEVDIRLIEKNRRKVQEKVRLIAGMLYTKEPAKLELRDEVDKYNMAILDGDIALEKNLFTGFATLVFLCHDPLAHSKNLVIEKNVEGTVINRGTWETTGILTITISSNANNLKVTLQNTGEYIYLEDSFKTGDVVEINLEEEYVKKNGNLIMDKLYFESDFFDIPVGEFNITSSNGIMDIEFRERWL